MADYYPLITRAVVGLEKDTAENRRALYERARSALVTRLRGSAPPLEEAEITRERLALEEAIRKVEVESARRAREAPKGARPAAAFASGAADTRDPDVALFDEALKLAQAQKREEAARREEATRREEAAKREEAARREEVARREEAARRAEAEKREEAAREAARREAAARRDEAAKLAEAARLEEAFALQSTVRRGSDGPTIMAGPPARGPSENPALTELAQELARGKPAQRPAVVETAEIRQAANSSVLPWAKNEANSVLDNALKEFRDVVDMPTARSETAKPAPQVSSPVIPFPTSARSKRPQNPTRRPVSPAPEPEQISDPVPDPLKALESFEPRVTYEDWNAAPAVESATTVRGYARDDAAVAPSEEPAVPPIEKRVRPRSLRSYRRLAWMLAVIAVIAGGTAAAYWRGNVIVDAGKNMIASLRPAPQPQQPQREAEPERPKDPDRVGQPRTSASSSAVPAGAQRAMLTTEPDAANPRGRDFVGRAMWRTETIPAAPGRPAEVAIRLDVEIPDRGFNMMWLIRRNTDTTLPATHTIDIEFNLASNSPLGRIAEIKSILMKQPGQVDGKALWGHAQRSTPTYFLVGLSAVAMDAEYNLKQLKEQPAFDVAMVFTNVGRAFLLIEKGPVGEKVFADAFAAWKQ